LFEASKINYSGPKSEIYWFSFFPLFVLYVNTRIALATLIGLIIIYFQISKSYSSKVTLKELYFSSFIVSVLFYSYRKCLYEGEVFDSNFSNMDKVGKLDEIDHPEIVVYSSLLRGYPSEIGLGTITKNLPFE
jgi:hypothetical protein